MTPLILSLITATLFLILAGTTYGAEAIVNSAWIQLVVWWLLGSGVTLFVLSKRAQP